MRRSGLVLLVCGLLLVPWIGLLAVHLHGVHRAAHWDVMWVGIDVAEAVGLVWTGLLAWRRDVRCRYPALVTATLLVLDAWVDLTTVHSDHLVSSALMAACIELPVAGLCVLLAARSVHRASAAGTRAAAAPAPAADDGSAAAGSAPTPAPGPAPARRPGVLPPVVTPEES